MTRIGEADGSNPATANVWDGEAWVKARVYMPNLRTGGTIAFVWDNKASGTCQECGGSIRTGESVYRAPLRPWRSKNDLLVHVRCWG
jgi:hypothetical protein